MKLRELLEEKRVYGQQYTPQEKTNLEKPSSKNIEKAFIVGKTIFDNEFGLGQTPSASNVNYEGFTVELDPQDFINIVSPADREDDAGEIFSKMKNNIPYGSPMLHVRCNLQEWKDGGLLKVKVASHDGRARSIAFSRLNPGLKMPVVIIPYGGLRASSFDESFFTELRKTGFIHQDKPLESKPIKVSIGKIFWNYTTL